MILGWGNYKKWLINLRNFNRKYFLFVICSTTAASTRSILALATWKSVFMGCNSLWSSWALWLKLWVNNIEMSKHRFSYRSAPAMRVSSNLSKKKSFSDTFCYYVLWIIIVSISQEAARISLRLIGDYNIPFHSHWLFLLTESKTISNREI